jgi:hypothetical protein
MGRTRAAASSSMVSRLRLAAWQRQFVDGSRACRQHDPASGWLRLLRSVVTPWLRRITASHSSITSTVPGAGLDAARQPDEVSVVHRSLARFAKDFQDGDQTGRYLPPSGHPRDPGQIAPAAEREPLFYFAPRAPRNILVGQV